MDWKEFASIAGVVLAIFGFLWRELRILDRKIDGLSKLLTDNLISMKGEIGELKGKSHSHSPAQ